MHSFHSPHHRIDQLLNSTRTVALNHTTHFRVIHLLAVSIPLNAIQQGTDDAVLDAAKETVSPDDECKLVRGAMRGQEIVAGQRTIYTSYTSVEAVGL